MGESNKKTVYRSSNSRRRKSSRMYRLLGAVLVFGIFIFGLSLFGRRSPRQPGSMPKISDIFTANKPTVTATVQDPSSLLSSAQEKVIEDYAYYYGQTLRTLTPRDISGLYSDPEGEEALLNNTAFKILASVRGLSQLDLKLEHVTMEYTISDVEQTSRGLKVWVTENNAQKFKHLSDESLSHNRPHVFILSESGGRWYIDSHLQEEDFYLLAVQAWERAPKSYTPRQKAEYTYNVLMDDAHESIEDNPKWQDNTTLPSGTYSYDRDRAVEYAGVYWNTRNYRRGYLAYDDFGGNCQNFCSQSIRAGGLAMDFSGPIGAQWKWYGEYLNESATASGRSYSWTGVDAFYNYATASYSKGVVCVADAPLSIAEKGDILQFGAYGEWRHSVLVTDVIYNEDGSVKDIVIASNTADRWNYPAAAYVYTAQRLIHILGQ